MLLHAESCRINSRNAVSHSSALSILDGCSFILFRMNVAGGRSFVGKYKRWKGEDVEADGPV